MPAGQPLHALSPPVSPILLTGNIYFPERNVCSSSETGLHQLLGAGSSAKANASLSGFVSLDWA